MKLRFWLICWLYVVAATHLLMGIMLAWFSHLFAFSNYNQLVLSKFWLYGAPAIAQDLHLWWLNLFGATLQDMAILMLVLIYLGDRLRLTVAWSGIIIGLLLWAPQDMWISAQRELWLHIWTDIVALLVMLPPLFLLVYLDRSLNPKGV